MLCYNTAMSAELGPMQAPFPIKIEKKIPPETKEKKKLLNPAMIGAQTVLLIGGKMPESPEKPETIEKIKTELKAIAGGKKIPSEGLIRGSLNERYEFWEGKESKYKDKSPQEKMDIWEKSANAFFKQYKEKPQQKFLKQIGIDLETENVAKEVYKKFIEGEGKGDVAFLAKEITTNNDPKQIEENVDFIEKLSKIYGENSAKVGKLLTEGLTNLNIDKDQFIESAQENIKQGDKMTGKDIIDKLQVNIKKWDDITEEIKRQQEIMKSGVIFQQKQKEEEEDEEKGKEE